MEPTRLNADCGDDERLEAILRESFPPLADAGFSIRVMAALPPKKRIGAIYGRIGVCGVGALSGAIFAWKRGLSSESMTVAASQVLESFARACAGLEDTRILLALAVTVLSLLYAFKAHLRPLPTLSKL